MQPVDPQVNRDSSLARRIEFGVQGCKLCCHQKEQPAMPNLAILNFGYKRFPGWKGDCLGFFKVSKLEFKQNFIHQNIH